jgi:hypothetical protein
MQYSSHHSECVILAYINMIFDADSGSWGIRDGNNFLCVTVKDEDFLGVKAQKFEGKIIKALINFTQRYDFKNKKLVTEISIEKILQIFDENSNIII